MLRPGEKTMMSEARTSRMSPWMQDTGRVPVGLGNRPRAVWLCSLSRGEQ